MRTLVALVSCALVLGACSSSSKPSSLPTTFAPGTTASTAATTTTVAAGPRSIGHVFVINLENENYNTSFGKSSPAHYLNDTLVKKGKLLTQYHGIGHASLDNYIAEISGQAPNPETQADCTKYTEWVRRAQRASEAPSVLEKYGQARGHGCLYPGYVKTVADQLTAAGKTWRGYMEDMGTPCGHPAIDANDTTIVPKPGDMYATRHNPFVYFQSITGSAACKQNVVDYTALATDLQSIDTTRNLTFITPNVCHDGHDAPCVDGKPGGLVSADLWLSTEVPKILASPAYQADGMLVITFDEAEITDGTACCHTPPDPNSATPGLSGPGGGRIGTLVLSSRTRAGTIDATPYNHYSLLCSIEDVFGLAHLGFAGAPGLACFGKDVYDVTS